MPRKFSARIVSGKDNVLYVLCRTRPNIFAGGGPFHAKIVNFFIFIRKFSNFCACGDLLKKIPNFEEDFNPLGSIS